tara:strand:- start:690 stop:1721 length:1032 start_codon:yes stop_codon:yes gene_type:complete
MVNKNFWKNKKVLITGHSGFKGAWLSIILNTLGSEVYGLSNNSNTSKIYDLHPKNYLKKEFLLDITDLSSDLEEVFKNNKFDYVFHLAAQAFVSLAKENPRYTLISNIIGTYNILDLINKHETTKNLIISTTDKVYLDPSKENIEEDFLGGFEFYGISKASAEMVIKAFSLNISNFNIRVIRSGNVLGPGDYGKDRLITDILNSVKQERPITIRNPNSIRPWQDIMDSLSGYILVAEHIQNGIEYDVFNLNAEINSDFKVKDLVEILLEKWNSKSEVIYKKNEELVETEILRLNSNKAKKKLGWSDKVEMNKIIEKIIDWEKSIPDIEKVTNLQILEYFELKG